MPRKYLYVGPSEIRLAAASSRSGVVIRTVDELQNWLAEQLHDAEKDGSIIATFVIDLTGQLLVAPRRSEHIACAGGDSVLSAGEMTFSPDGEILEVTNQSTGYCPEPESWPHVTKAIQRIGVSCPSDFTTKILFRLCPQCKERSIVKDNWYCCELCGADLPVTWNFCGE